MAIIRIYTGADGKSHFQEIEPDFQEETRTVEGRTWPLDARAEIHEEKFLLNESKRKIDRTQVLGEGTD